MPDMVEITDAYMDARLKTARPFVLVLMKSGPAYEPPEMRTPEQAAIVREHGRRNMQFSAEGKMAVVGPVRGGLPIVGLCIFTCPEAEVRGLLADDPAVRAGILTYDVMTMFGFPGDGLPLA